MRNFILASTLFIAATPVAAFNDLEIALSSPSEFARFGRGNRVPPMSHGAIRTGWHPAVNTWNQ